LDACFVVKDSSGQKLGYFYFDAEPSWRSAAKLLTKGEDRRAEAVIAFATDPADVRHHCD